MKFGKCLRIQIEETVPEWRDEFLSYKDLKQHLKLIEPAASSSSSTAAAQGPPPLKRPRLSPTHEGGAPEGAASPAAAAAMTAEEEEFMRLLEAELDKFNFFFLEKEEEYVIRQKVLQDRLRMSMDPKEEMMVKKEIVDFHGEMVLLENYSALNYTGLVKILKKYDKRTGAALRQRFIQKVLQQPFFTTDLLDKLIKECERMLDGLLPLPATDPSVVEEEAVAASSSTSATEQSGTGSAPASQAEWTLELEEIEYMKSLYMKRTLAALRVLREIRSGSSTVSFFSLPPLQARVVENRWPKTPPVVEQTAK